MSDEPTDVDLLAGMRTGDWLDAQQFPPLRYAVPGVIPEGSCLFVGPPKVGKSWLTLDVALAVAAGGRTLGQLAVGRARPVLLLALEDGDRRLQDRCRRLLGDEPIPSLLHYLTRTMPGQVIATVEHWLTRYGGDAPLVILDTLGKTMPPAMPGESAYGRDYRVGGALKRAIESCPGASLVTVHHDRKAGSDDFVDAVSGTHGLAGAADTILVLTRDRSETTGTLSVTGRDVPESVYALTFYDGSRWQLDGVDLDSAARRAIERKASAGLGDRSTEIVAFLGQHPEGVGPTEIGIKFGIEAKAAGTYVGRLLDAGRIVKLGRGKYGLSYMPVESVESVESEAGESLVDSTVSTVSTPSQEKRCTRCGFPIDPAIGDVSMHPSCGAA